MLALGIGERERAEGCIPLLFRSPGMAKESRVQHRAVVPMDT
jgi:hypothetical protein